MQLGGAHRARPAAPGSAVARGGQARDPVAGDGHERGRNERDARAGQSRAHREIEPLVGAAEGRIDPLEGTPRVGSHQHAAHVGAEHVVGHVVLPLVELVVGEAHRAPGGRHRHSERDDLGAVLPPHEFRSDEGDGGRQLEGAGEAGERVGLGGGVLREQPDRVAVEAVGAQGGGGGEGGAGGGGDDRLRTG